MMLLDKTTQLLRKTNMHPIVDGIMIVLFILFMVFIFGGYHKTKSAEREAEFKRDKERKKKQKSQENS